MGCGLVCYYPCSSFLFSGVLGRGGDFNMMDATVAAAVTSGITSFQGDALTQLATVVPIALVVTISVALLFKTLGWFRGLVKI